MSEIYETVEIAGTPGDRRTLILLHGTGGNARGFAALSERIAPGAHVLSLQGDVLEDGMARFFRRLDEGIYDMDDLARGAVKLAVFAQEAIDMRGRDAEAVAFVGFSNGANLIAASMLMKPGIVRRAVLMHPLIPFEIDPELKLDGIEVLITAGRRDAIAPWSQTEALVDGLRRAGASVTLVDSSGGHEMESGEIAAVRDWLAPLRVG